MIKKLQQIIYNLLKKSEKFFQTDMIYLAKGGFWLTLGQIVSSLSSFLLAIAFANLLPKETYGTYKYVLSLVGILSIFTLSGMNTSLTRSVARGFEGSLKPILKEKIKWGSIGSLVSLGIAAYYYLNGNLTLTICFVITAVFLPLMDPLGIYVSFLNGRKNFKLSTKYQAWSRVIATILMILILIFTKNIFLILFTYFIFYTTCRFIFLKITFKKQRPNSEKELGTISYGWHLSLIKVISLIANNLDKIVLWHLLGASSLAIYSMSTAAPNQIKSFLQKIYTLIFPKFSKQKYIVLQKTIPKKAPIFSGFLIITIAIYILICPYIFKIFFPRYLESINFSKIFILSFISMPGAFFINAFLAHNMKSEIYIIRIGVPLFKIILIFILTPIYGILGVILSYIMSGIFSLILSFILFNRKSSSH